MGRFFDLPDPCVGIGVFLLPLTPGIAKQVQGAQLARHNHASTAVTGTTIFEGEAIDCPNWEATAPDR
jgi:hypothetical protein